MEQQELNVYSHSFGPWVSESINDFAMMRYKIKDVLFAGQSQFQKVDVVTSQGYGRMLFLDNLVMLSERDEFVYHDMIAHVPLFLHPAPKKVLVIGGGDGGTAREILRHTAVESCVMVEIDGMVVEVSKKFLPFTAGELENPRLTLKIADGVRYLAETQAKFDVIIIDSTDPIGPAKPLFGPEFYSTVYSALNDGGIVVSQAESPFYEAEAQKSVLSSIRASFTNAYVYNYSNLTYPGGIWSFSLACKGNLDPVKDFDKSKVANSGMAFKYYHAGLHQAVFQIPQFQKDHLKDLILN